MREEGDCSAMGEDATPAQAASPAVPEGPAAVEGQELPFLTNGLLKLPLLISGVEAIGPLLRSCCRCASQPAQPSIPPANCRVPLPADDLSFLSRSSSPVAKPRTRTCPHAAPALRHRGHTEPRRIPHRLPQGPPRGLTRSTAPLSGTSEASHSRIAKRVKGSLQLAEEADKEHKKMADKINERTEVVKTSYKKFVTEKLRCRPLRLVVLGMMRDALNFTFILFFFYLATVSVLTLLVVTSVQGDCS
ncbi:hypothetical protein EJB05_29791, partial [Eragrostis curvula]